MRSPAAKPLLTQCHGTWDFAQRTAATVITRLSVIRAFSVYLFFLSTNFVWTRRTRISPGIRFRLLCTHKFIMFRLQRRLTGMHLRPPARRSRSSQEASSRLTCAHPCPCPICMGCIPCCLFHSHPGSAKACCGR